MPLPLARLLTAVAVLAGAQLGLGLLAPPAAAAERVITITADGPDPVTLAGVRKGDTIVFVNGDQAFPHTVASRAGDWSFSATINPGARYEGPEPLTAAGRYVYGDNSPLEDYEGEVVVGSTATAKPTRKPSASASPRPSRPAASEDPEPTPTPSTGTVTTPPLIGGVPPTAAPSTSGPPPVAAPEPSETADPGEEVVALPEGTLPQPYAPRAYGLPAAVAAVAAVGTGSLLVRVLLAHPAARRRLPSPVVTVTDPDTA